MNIDKQTAAELAMVMYVGERCRYCGHEYTSIQELIDRSVVWAHRRGTDPPINGLGQSLACKACFDRQMGTPD